MPKVANRFGATIEDLTEAAQQLKLLPEDTNVYIDATKVLTPMDVYARSKTAKEKLGAIGEKALAWLDRYKDLLQTGWPWRVAAYIAWASSPKLRRWPKTQEELAIEVLGLTSDRAIATWRLKNASIDQVIALLQSEEMLQYRADSFAALGESAADPDYKHNPDRQLLHKMTGDYVPEVKIDDRRKPTLDDLKDKSDEELIKELRKKELQTTSDQDAAVLSQIPSGSEGDDGATE